MKHGCFGRSVFALIAFGHFAHAAEKIPPAPAHYFNDYASVVSAEVARTLDQKLESFERETSNQLVVAVFPKMETDSSLEDYSQRMFEAWKVGQQKLDNGAVLFVFIADRKLRIHTGYGLEGALPDVTCKRIIENEITPRFKQQDYAGGLTAGVDAMIAATRGEYKGTGKIASDRTGQPVLPFVIFFFIFIAALISKLRWPGGGVYTSRGFSSSSSFGGGSWGGGSSGGGFSGGGGSSGGGGASGSW